MREFKFRAWHHGGGDPRVEPYMTCISFSLECFWRNIEQDDLSVEVMQFTGLTDKNGVEIYEGDVCVNENGRIAECKYHKPSACFDFISLNDAGDSYGYSPQMWKYKLAIIGNIYENPELLKDNEL